MENGKKPAFYNPNSYFMQGDDGIGLTKREYFAGLSMQGLLSNSEFIKAGSFDFISKGTEKRISQIATSISDALIAELEKTEN